MDYLPASLIPPNLRDRERNFYAMPFRWPVGIGAGLSVPAAIQVDSGLDFVGVAVTGTVIVAGVVVPLPYASIEFRTSSGRLLQSEPGLWGDVVGTAQRPGILPFPAIILGGTRVTVTLTNLSGAAFDDVSVNFLGFNVFAEGWPM